MSQIADSSFSGDVITYSFLFTAILVLLHLAAPYIRRTPWLARKGFTSFSGGFAVAYVFLHMLPGLVESKDAIGEILHSYFVGVHFVEISVFLLAFLGFIFFSVSKDGVAKNLIRVKKKSIVPLSFRLHHSVSTT